MVILKRNKNIIAAFAFFAILSFILIQKLAVPQDFIEVTIIQGDTLTQLAEEYAGDTNKERWIHKVSLLNDLSDSAIIAGEGIKIPVSQDMELDDTRLVLAEERK